MPMLAETIGWSSDFTRRMRIARSETPRVWDERRKSDPCVPAWDSLDKTHQARAIASSAKILGGRREIGEAELLSLLREVAP